MIPLMDMWSSFFGDTWKFLGGSWTNITSSSGPSPRVDGSMAYDAVDGYVVAFGGARLTGNGSPAAFYGDTWKFLGSSWTNITSSSGPSPRDAASMAYDSADRYVILFGGSHGSGFLSDTWKFLGGSWTNITSSSGPSPRALSSMAYDAVDSFVIAFGGLTAIATTNGTSITAAFGDTWKFLGGSWTNITSSGPSPRATASMAYDAADGYVVLFGGVSNSALYSDTWKFSSTATPAFDYSLSNSGPVSITQGTSVAVTVDAKLTAGTPRPVTLSCSGLPSGITCGGFTVDPVTPTTAGATSGLTIIVASSLTPGSYTFHVTGSPAGATASAATTTVTFTVSTPGPWTNITPSTSPSPRVEASMAYDAADGYVILFGGGLSSSSSGFMDDTWKFLGGSWTNITSSTSPSPRDAASMAYDPADGYVILFGGSSASTTFGDTWRFLGGLWTNITPSTGPSPRAIASMAYDAADGYVILFGGYGSAGYLGDTWKFLGGSWTDITPSSGPSPRDEAAMVYDSADRYIVLFGGYGSSFTIFGDTWKFVGGSWTNITPSTGPSRRYSASIAYDAADGYVALFSGDDGHLFSDTWSFLRGSWTNITSSTGLYPYGATSMTYDPADGYVILFSGPGDSWKFSSPSTQPAFDYSLSNSGPVSITQGTSVGMTITATLTAGNPQSVTLSCSGLPSGITCGNFTLNPVTPTGSSGLTVSVASKVTPGSYTFQVTGSPVGATASAATTVTVNVSTLGPWTNITPSTGPSSRAGASMVYDATDGYVVLFGGGTSATVSSTVVIGDTWKYLGGSWTNITSSTGPSSRIGASMVYDVVDGYVILFGGYNGSTYLRDTWKFLAGSWTNSMAYDAADGYVVVFGGQTVTNTGSTPSGDTWRFLSGSWTNITSSGGPSPRAVASMAYDPVDGYVILFGGFGGSVFLGDTWTFLRGSWTNITSSSDPSPRGGMSMVYDVADGYVVAFGGTSSTSPTGTPFGETWKYLGGSWTNVASSSGPSPRLIPSMAYDTADGYLIVFGGGISSTVAIGDTWKFFSTAPPAFDYSLSINGPVSITAGSSGSVTITVKLISGTAQSVALSCVAPLRSGVTCTSFSSMSVTPSSSGATSTLTISVSSTIAPGSYSVMITGSPLGATTASTTVSVTVTARTSMPPVSQSITSGGVTFKVTSNSTVSNTQYDAGTHKISFQVSGGAGVGVANMTVPKSIVPSGGSFNVTLDSGASNFIISQDANNYYVYVTYPSSTRTVYISFASSPTPQKAAPTILGLAPSIFTAILGVVGAVVSAVIGLAYRAKSRKSSD